MCERCRVLKVVELLIISTRLVSLKDIPVGLKLSISRQSLDQFSSMYDEVPVHILID
jgi:hypothetical protein